MLDRAYVPYPLLSDEIDGDRRSIDFHVSILYRRDAIGVIFLRIFVASDPETAVGHEAQDKRHLLFFGVSLGIEILVNLSHDALIRFSKLDHLLKLPLALFFLEGLVIHVLGSTFSIVTNRQDLLPFLEIYLDVVVRRRD